MPSLDTLGPKRRDHVIDLSKHAPLSDLPRSSAANFRASAAQANVTDADIFYEFMSDIQAPPVLRTPTTIKRSSRGWDADRAWWLALALISLVLLAGILAYAVQREYGANSTSGAGRGNGGVVGGQVTATPSITPTPAVTPTPWPTDASQAPSAVPQSL